MRHVQQAFILLLGFVLLSGCQYDKTDSKENSQLYIYTSIYPLQYATEQIAGEHATIESIYPPGVDAHTYEPSAKEITDIARGDMFIYMGAGMESFAETIVDALQAQDVTFLEIGQQEELFLHQDSTHEDGHNHGHHHVDPHIWLDPLRMIDVGEQITTSLSELDPEHQNQYKQSFFAFKDKMEQLDDAYTEVLQSKSTKKIIVSHAAYGYWEERYGLEQISISGLSANEHPSQKQLTKIANQAKDNQLQHVIFEANGSNHIATIIQEYIDADRLYIHNLEVLTDEEITNEEDYISLMEKNLHVLDQATN